MLAGLFIGTFSVAVIKHHDQKQLTYRRKRVFFFYFFGGGGLPLCEEEQEAGWSRLITQETKGMN